MLANVDLEDARLVQEGMHLFFLITCSVRHEGHVNLGVVVRVLGVADRGCVTDRDVEGQNGGLSLEHVGIFIEGTDTAKGVHFFRWFLKGLRAQALCGGAQEFLGVFDAGSDARERVRGGESALGGVGHGVEHEHAFFVHLFCISVSV